MGEVSFQLWGREELQPQELLPQELLPPADCPSYLYVHTGAAAAVLGPSTAGERTQWGSPVNLLCSSAWGKGQDQQQEAKMSLPPRGSWLGHGAGARSSDIAEELKVEPLLLCAERSLLRWFSLRTWFRPVHPERDGEVLMPCWPQYWCWCKWLWRG